MYIGKYYHTLDKNGRISLPSEFRQKNTQWIVTRGLDGGLMVFPEENFHKVLEQIKDKSFTRKAHRDLTRLLTNEAKTLEADKQGRVQLPEYLTKFAGLDQTVVWVGSYNYLEVWDRDRYHNYMDELEPQYEAIAESFDQNE